VKNDAANSGPPWTCHVDPAVAGEESRVIFRYGAAKECLEMFLPRLRDQHDKTIEKMSSNHAS
jgi:hypothetical protein